MTVSGRQNLVAKRTSYHSVLKTIMLVVKLPDGTWTRLSNIGDDACNLAKHELAHGRELEGQQHKAVVDNHALKPARDLTMNVSIMDWQWRHNWARYQAAFRHCACSGSTGHD